MTQQNFIEIETTKRKKQYIKSTRRPFFHLDERICFKERERAAQSQSFNYKDISTVYFITSTVSELAYKGGNSSSDHHLKSLNVYVCMCLFVRKSDRKTSSHSSLFANLPVIIRKMLNKIPVMVKC